MMRISIHARTKPLTQPSAVFGSLYSATKGTIDALTIADMTEKAKIRTEKCTSRNFLMHTKFDAVTKLKAYY